MKLGFIFNSEKPQDRAFVDGLVERYGGVPAAQADILIPVGGDGSVLHVLPQARNRMVYGLIPPDSASVGYTANRYEQDENLRETIAAARQYALYPLKATVCYQNGHKDNLRAFNSFSLVSDNGQATKLDLSANFNGVSRSLRLVGDGVAFSTSLGSTGLALSHGGPIMSPAQRAMIFTGLGLGWPLGMRPILAIEHESFSVKPVLGDGKRDLRLNIDGNSFRPDTQNPIVSLDIEIAKKSWGKLISKTGSFHPFKRLTPN